MLMMFRRILLFLVILMAHLEEKLKKRLSLNPANHHFDPKLHSFYKRIYLINRNRLEDANKIENKKRLQNVNRRRKVYI